MLHLGSRRTLIELEIQAAGECIPEGTPDFNIIDEDPVFLIDVDALDLDPRAGIEVDDLEYARVALKLYRQRCECPSAWSVASPPTSIRLAVSFTKEIASPWRPVRVGPATVVLTPDASVTLSIP